MAEHTTDIKSRIKALIGQGESSEVEFKSARGGFPGSFWESYSAFANTNGGTIVLGVVEKDNRFSFDGLTEETIVRYKKIFWDCAHNKGKISVCLPRESDVRIEQIEESYILICDIPRANYELRPVYIGSNPFGSTYRRNHEGDYLCTDAEVRRMFADAEHDRHSQDGRILAGFEFERDIDKESLHQYRQTLASLQPTHPWIGISDMDFLKKIGAYTTEYETGKEGFTLAGILMFGKYDSITNPSGDPMYFVGTDCNRQSRHPMDAPYLSRWHVGSKSLSILCKGIQPPDTVAAPSVHDKRRSASGRDPCPRCREGSPY